MATKTRTRVHIPCGRVNRKRARMCVCLVRQARAHIEGDAGFALQEAREDLLLDLGQVVLMQGLLASLHAVLAVGQDQGQQVSLQLVEIGRASCRERV